LQQGGEQLAELVERGQPQGGLEHPGGQEDGQVDGGQARKADRGQGTGDGGGPGDAALGGQREGIGGRVDGHVQAEVEAWVEGVGGQVGDQHPGGIHRDPDEQGVPDEGEELVEETGLAELDQRGHQALRAVPP
jgi:hypothetical protein